MISNSFAAYSIMNFCRTDCPLPWYNVMNSDEILAFVGALVLLAGGILLPFRLDDLPALRRKVLGIVFRLGRMRLVNPVHPVEIRCQNCGHPNLQPVSEYCTNCGKLVFPMRAPAS
jgi:hypothetical protein